METTAATTASDPPPLSGGGGDMPTWSEYLSQIEADAPPEIDLDNTTTTPLKKKPVRRPLKKPAMTEEAKERKRQRDLEVAKRRKDMRKFMNAKRQDNMSDTLSIIVSPQKGKSKKTVLIATAMASPVVTPSKSSVTTTTSTTTSSVVVSSDKQDIGSVKMQLFSPAKTIPSLDDVVLPSPSSSAASDGAEEEDQTDDEPVTPLSGGGLVDADGNAIPTWQEYMKTLETAEPLPQAKVPFGSKPSGLNTPSKNRTPKKKPLTEEQKEKQQKRKEAADARRKEMKMMMAEKRQELSDQTLITPDGEKLVVANIEVMEDVEQSEAFSEESRNQRQLEAEKQKEKQLLLKAEATRSRQVEVEKRLRTKEAEAVQGSLQNGLIPPSELRSTVVNQIETQLWLFEQNLLSSAKEAQSETIASLERQNSLLKEQLRKGHVDEVNEDVAMLQKASAIWKKRALAAEAQLEDAQSQISHLTQERDDVTKLCDELITKFEASQASSAEEKK
eukprot:TRINITY_DN404_c0_g1_i2.p1 TRINITY_DN404_c0_g1~~TRINITY_DN404_c0_g1_i2.p1  ORF type:complete len:509 (+),score=190.70 TRINITY_DN404_c0_g1_i2:22-1527(+)